MEITRASMVMVAIVTLIFAVFFPAAMAHSPAPAPAPAPAPTSDGAAIDQGIAYVLMLVALAVTYLVH